MRVPKAGMSSAGPTRRGPPLHWPRDRQTEVPRAVDVAALDSRARAALAAAGVSADAQVGAPITVHFAREVDEGFRPSLSCRVLNSAGAAIPGVLVDYSDRAPGCFAYLPTAPLAAGEWLEVRWQVPTTLLGADEGVGSVTYRVR